MLTGINKLGPDVTQPRFSGVSHISLPCSDLEKSKIFYSEVMGGERVHEIAGFVEYKIETSLSGFPSKAGGGQAPKTNIRIMPSTSTDRTSSR